MAAMKLILGLCVSIQVMRLLTVTGELFNRLILNQFLGTAQEGHKSCSIHLNLVVPVNAVECIYLP